MTFARNAVKSVDNEPANRDAAAVYIATLSGEMARMARKFGYDTLGYILDMARMEAENVSRPRDAPSQRP